MCGFGRWAKLVLRGPGEVGRDEGKYPPQLIVRRDDQAHRRHGPDDVLRADARVALALQYVAPERNEPEQRVVVPAVHPDVVGEWRAHAPPPTAPLAAPPAVTHSANGPPLPRPHALRRVPTIWLPPCPCPPPT